VEQQKYHQDLEAVKYIRVIITSKFQNYFRKKVDPKIGAMKLTKFKIRQVYILKSQNNRKNTETLKVMNQ
jgi:hypothetical protein